MVDVSPIVLCGGAGSRLWPLSRAGFPKQFLCLTDDQSLFQHAIQRLTELDDTYISVSTPIIVTNEEHRFIALEQLRETVSGIGTVILEPFGRNTAPALTLAAMAAQEQGSDPVLVVTPADHIFTDQPTFTATVRQAILEAANGAIVVLGVTPDRPETGFGYIKKSLEADTISQVSSFSLECFVEKPDLASAQRYVREGGYYWNSGIFVLKASVWIAALEHFRPDVALPSKAAWTQNSRDKHFVRPGKVEFSNVPAVSIDYAVMERCPGSKFEIKMIPLDAGWSDLGAWNAVWQSLTKDASDNVRRGDVLVQDSRSNLIYATSRLVSLVGVENLVVIETSDAVLVADLSSSQGVKDIVAKLEAGDREEHIQNRKTHRPWGWYDTVDVGQNFKVKRIRVNPNASLSLQKHQHRAEHWIVVRGLAEITRGNETFKLSENQSTYISAGETHRLKNPTSAILEIIEVQSGTYLGEDDIVRLDDSFARVN